MYRKSSTNEKLAINFIGIVITSWHLDNLMAYITNYQAELKSGIIYILPQKIENKKYVYRINEIDSNIVSKNIQFHFLKNDFKDVSIHFHHILFNQNRLSIISPGNINYQILKHLNIFRCKIKYIIIDEGLGAYLPSKIFNNIAVVKKDPKGHLSFFLEKFLKYLIRKFLINKIEDQRFFQIKSNFFIPNSAICGSLKENYIRISQTIRNNESSIILFKDYKVLDNQFQFAMYVNIFNWCNIANIKLYIKKHPLDNNEDFNQLALKFTNTEIIKSTQSGESLIAQYQPKLIIGGLTTALFSSAFIYNIPTVSYMLLYKSFPSLSKSHRFFIDFFYNKLNYCKMISFIDKEEELKKIFAKYGKSGL